jgi:flagellar biosynthetic protein FliP
MMVMGTLVSAGIRLAGGDYARIGPEAGALLMAFNMSAGMTLWMRYRRHRWPAILEMDGAMFASFAVIFPLLWVDVLSEDAMYVIGHVLMLPAMLAVVLHRHERTNA